MYYSGPRCVGGCDAPNWAIEQVFSYFSMKHWRLKGERLFLNRCSNERLFAQKLSSFYESCKNNLRCGTTNVVLSYSSTGEYETTFVVLNFQFCEQLVYCGKVPEHLFVKGVTGELDRTYIRTVKEQWNKQLNK